MLPYIGSGDYCFSNSLHMSLLGSGASAESLPSTGFIMEELHVTLSMHWLPFVTPYRLKIEQAEKDMGYADPIKRDGHVGTLVGTLLLLLIWAGKEIEEITRADFEAFTEEYHNWYLQAKSPSGHTDSRLARIERFLVHWGLIPPKRRVFRHEEYLSQILL